MTKKNLRGCGSRRNSHPHRRVPWRDPQSPRMYTKPPTWESAPERPSLLVGSRSDWKLAESWTNGIVPSLTRLPHTALQQWHGLPNPGEYLRLHHLQRNRCAKTKKCGPEEQIKTPKTTKWWRDSQPIWCRVQNTWLQNRGKSEIKTGNQQWREGNWDSMNWSRRKI